MTKIMTRFKRYITEPSQCFIPKCKARCCVNAPLPEGFLPKFKDKIQLDIFSATNIGVNDINDTYNSIIYDTNPIKVLGKDKDGKTLVGIPKDVLQRLQIQSIEQVQKLMELYDGVLNYCPFITEYGKCAVYKDRPPICKEFGTDTKNPLNRCPEKSSRLEIFKEYLKLAFDYRPTFRFLKEKFATKFMKQGT